MNNTPFTPIFTPVSSSTPSSPSPSPSPSRSLPPSPQSSHEPKPSSSSPKISISAPNKEQIIQYFRLIQLFILTIIAYRGFTKAFSALSNANLDYYDLDFARNLFNVKVEKFAITELIINGIQLIISLLAFYFIFFATNDQINNLIKQIPFIGTRVEDKTQKLT